MKTIRTLLLAALLLPTLVTADERSELIAKGDVYDERYQPNEALEHYLPAEKLDANDADLLVKIARQFVYRMDLLSSKSDQATSAKTALDYAERAVKRQPNSSDAHLSVAICLSKYVTTQGNREKVEASKRIRDEAEKAIALNPKNDLAWHILGRWHQSLADMGGLTRGIASLVYGGLPEASFEKSIDCFEKAIALKPNRLINYVELGRTYAAMGNEAEARKYLQKGLSMPNQDQDDPDTKARGQKTLNELG